MPRFLYLPLLLLSSGVFSIVVVLCAVCWPIASGRFLHLVVLYGYHGADRDAEQLSLTDQLFDAAFGGAWGCCVWISLVLLLGFQRGAHQNPLLV